MNTKTIIIAVALVVAGALGFAVMNSGGSSDPAQSATENGTTMADGQLQGAVNIAQEVMDKNPPLNTKDMLDIKAIAQGSLDEAHATYSYFLQRVMDNKADNTQELEVLLTSTMDLSEVDGSNDHYIHLTKLWNQYPDKMKAALEKMNISNADKDEILATVKSFTDSLKNGNG